MEVAIDFSEDSGSHLYSAKMSSEAGYTIDCVFSILRTDEASTTVALKRKKKPLDITMCIVQSVRIHVSQNYVYSVQLFCKKKHENDLILIQSLSHFPHLTQVASMLLTKWWLMASRLWVMHLQWIPTFPSRRTWKRLCKTDVPQTIINRNGAIVKLVQHYDV